MLLDVKIDFGKPLEINFAPATILEEIAQNVVNISVLTKGEVPYQRYIGFNPDIIDQPTTKAMMMYQVDLAEQLDKFEPRAEIRSFDWNKSDFTNGYLKVKLTIFINESIL